MLTKSKEIKNYLVESLGGKVPKLLERECAGASLNQPRRPQRTLIIQDVGETSVETKLDQTKSARFSLC